MDIKAIVSATVSISDNDATRCAIHCSFLSIKPYEVNNKQSYCCAFGCPSDIAITSLAREPKRERDCIRVFGLDSRDNFEIGEQTTIPLAPAKSEAPLPDPAEVKMLKFPETAKVRKGAYRDPHSEDFGTEPAQDTEPANEQELELIPDPFLVPDNVAPETEADPASATDNDIEEVITAVVDRDDPVNWKKNDGWSRYDANNPPPVYEFADVYGVRFGRWGFGTEREVVKKVKVMACDDSIRDLLKIGAGVGYGSVAGSEDNVTIISWRPHVPRGRKAGRNAKPEELR